MFCIPEFIFAADHVDLRMFQSVKRVKRGSTVTTIVTHPCLCVTICHEPKRCMTSTWTSCYVLQLINTLLLLLHLHHCKLSPQCLTRLQQYPVRPPFHGTASTDRLCRVASPSSRRTLLHRISAHLIFLSSDLYRGKLS